MLIAIEGIDAAGKQTQVARLVEKLSVEGHRASKLSFPDYQNVSGNLVADFLHGKWSVACSTMIPDVNSYVFQCCQLVNKLESLPRDIWSASTETVYIADRYNASAYAYGLASGLDLDWLLRVYASLPQPDLNVFLDITVEESFKRRPQRRDVYEKDITFLKGVRQSYIDVFNSLGQSYVVIDAMADKDVVFDRIYELVSRALK